MFQGVSHTVQLLRVAAVVLEHIAHERQGLFRRELGRIAVFVVVPADVLVRMFVCVFAAAAGVTVPALVQQKFCKYHLAPSLSACLPALWPLKS